MKEIVKEKTMDMNTAVSLLNIKEDVLEDEVSGSKINSVSEAITPRTHNGKAKQAKSMRMKTEVNTYEKLLASAVKKLGCTANELTGWLNKLRNTPEAVQYNALRLITKHELDPFVDEITILQYEDGYWQAFITIDGWSKLINSHPAFSGISFTESSELVSGVPTWMGCAIYRNDRVVPIDVKEYFCEIQTEHEIWKEMPRRMLRHRVMAQCARLAFGISIPENIKTVKLAQENAAHITKQKEHSKKMSQTENLKIHLNKNLEKKCTQLL
jgi:hypothetical protein